MFDVKSGAKKVQKRHCRRASALVISPLVALALLVRDPVGDCGCSIRPSAVELCGLVACSEIGSVSLRAVSCMPPTTLSNSSSASSLRLGAFSVGSLTKNVELMTEFISSSVPARWAIAAFALCLWLAR